MSYIGFCPPGVIMPYAGAVAPDGWLLCNGAEISKTDYAALLSALSYSASVTTVNASTSVTTTSTAYISVGASVTGTGIPAGAYVTSITSATVFVISSAATAAGTVTATFGLYDRQIDPTSGTSSSAPTAYAAPAAGNFRIPDYRGLFLRGTGNPTGTKGDGTNGSFDAVRLGDMQAQKTGKNGIAGTATKFANDNHSHSLSNAGGTAFYMYANSGAGFSDFFANFTGPTVSMSKFGTNSGGGAASGTSTLNSVALTGNTDANSTSTGATAIAGDIETRPINRGVNYIIKI